MFGRRSSRNDQNNNGNQNLHKEPRVQALAAVLTPEILTGALLKVQALCADSCNCIFAMLGCKLASIPEATQAVLREQGWSGELGDTFTILFGQMADNYTDLMLQYGGDEEMLAESRPQMVEFFMQQINPAGATVTKTVAV